MEFTGIKDVDLKIFSELDDISLLRVCSVNKNIRNHVCKDEIFWKNRFIEKNAIQYKPENRSWKNYYLQVLIDLDRFSKDPIKFINNIVWMTDIDHSFYVPSNVDIMNIKKHLTPLKDAPEWVLNNLYLLNLGKIILRPSILSDAFTLENPKPIDLLIVTSKYSNSNHMIRGFEISQAGKYYYPDIYHDSILQ